MRQRYVGIGISWVLVLAWVVVLGSCTRKQTVDQSHPESVVRAFVKLSTEAKQPSDKDILRDLCRGPMFKALDEMSVEQFRVSYLRNHLTLKDLLMLGTTLEGDEATVHYRVIIENKLGTDPTEEANEREVELIRLAGKWYLEVIRPKGKDQIAFTQGLIL